MFTKSKAIFLQFRDNSGALRYEQERNGLLVHEILT